jgi:hypothetical protein
VTFDPQRPARERTPFGNFQLRPSHLTTKAVRVPYANEGTGPSPQERAAARLAVCARSEDAADARHLLDALGLLD